MSSRRPDVAPPAFLARPRSLRPTPSLDGRRDSDRASLPFVDAARRFRQIALQISVEAGYPLLFAPMASATPRASGVPRMFRPSELTLRTPLHTKANINSVGILHWTPWSRQPYFSFQSKEGALSQERACLVLGAKGAVGGRNLPTEITYGEGKSERR
jgi:hypothetical protein